MSTEAESRPDYSRRVVGYVLEGRPGPPPCRSMIGREVQPDNELDLLGQGLKVRIPLLDESQSFLGRVC